MFEREVEDDIPSQAVTYPSDNVEIHEITDRPMVRKQEIRQGDDGMDVIIACSSSPIKDAISDPIFAPVRKVPVELLAEIFVLCIPPLTLEGPKDMQHRVTAGTHPRQVRARLGLVCRAWNAVLNNEPHVWVTLVLDNQLPAPRTVSRWIKKSKSLQLDVYIDPKHWYHRVDTQHPWDRDQGQVKTQTILSILRRKLWRIRSLIAIVNDSWKLSDLFPLAVSTDAPIMQSFTLNNQPLSYSRLQFGGIHCPELQTLCLRDFVEAVANIKPVQSVRHLHITAERYQSISLPLKFLKRMPNIDTLTLMVFGPSVYVLPRLELKCLKSLTLDSYEASSTTRFLSCLYVPSLENLQLSEPNGVHERLDINKALHAICGDGTVHLRYLALRHITMRDTNFYAILRHLQHLETLVLENLRNSSPDVMLVALSPHNRDFNSACPQLKTVELAHVRMTPCLLVDFVRQRMVSDLDDPAPGMVTCLKLSGIDGVESELLEQLAKTHSKSIKLIL